MKRPFHAAIFLVCLFVSAAQAQTTYTWTGLAGDSVFSNPANWLGNVAPAGNATDNIVFPSLPPEQQTGYFVNANLGTPASVGNVSFLGSYYFFYMGGAGPLTLNGNVVANNVGYVSTPVILSAGNHTISGDNYLFLNGDLTGPGGLILNGPGTLALFGTTSTFSGGTVVNGGNLIISANSQLGTGSLTLNGGTFTGNSSGSIQVYKDIAVGANVTLATNISDGFFYLGNGDGSDITPASGVTTVNLNLGYSNTSIFLTGDLRDGSGATTYAFSRDYPDDNAFILTGSNDYTGGTLVQNGGSIVFGSAGAIPAAGLITAQADGYAAISSNSSQAVFLSHLDAANYSGTIGFENGDIYSGAINLAGFTAAGGTAAIGTRNSATLTGLITPSATSNEYRFRNSGTLILSGTNPLSGSNSLVAGTQYGSPGTGRLVLQQSVANTYTGGTYVDNTGLVFNSATALPAATALHLANGGYVSVSDASGLTLASLATKLAGVTNGGILGFDTADSLQGYYLAYNYSAPVDFSALTTNVYLGTSSQKVNFSGLITTANGNTGDYFLTGYYNGQLEVSSQLTGASRVLHVGAPGADNGMVLLTHTGNTYGGGTVLNAGYLVVAAAASLGTGAITVDAPGSTVSLEGPTNGTLSSNIALNAGQLSLYWSNGALSGLISGSGGLSISSDLTLSHANTYSGGTEVVDGVRVYATDNAALGTGSLTLSAGSSVWFSTANPQIGSLLEGSTYYYDGDGVYEVSSSLKFADTAPATLTINQTEDGDFEGVIGQGAFIGSLVKQGAGTLTIGGYLGQDNGPHTPYSGGTTITGGKLIAGSETALGTGTITLNGGELATVAGVNLTNPIAFGAFGGTLGGNGTFSVPITAGANVTLAPGASPGTLTFASGLTLAGAGNLAIEIQSAAGPAGTGYDLVNVSNGLLDITATAGSPFTITLTSLDFYGSPGNVPDFSLGLGYSWMIFQGNSVSGINGFAANKFSIVTSGFTNDFTGGSFSLSQGLNGANPAIFLNFTPVPEPSAYALLALGLAPVLLRLRSRRRR